MGQFKLGKWRIYPDITKICAHFKPDLVINTGDLFRGCKSDRRIQKVLKDFDTHVNLPWAFAWGNHDCEYFEPNHWFDRFDQIETWLAHLPHCLYKQSRQFIENYGVDTIQENPREYEAYLKFVELAMKEQNSNMDPAQFQRFDGFYGGNYHLQICNPKTKLPAWELFVMNSRRAYHIPPKALRWMQNQLNSHTQKVPSLAFFHVPVYEYDTNWNSGNAHGIKGESVGYELDRGEIHQFFKHLESLKGCFVGHDHGNDYYFDADGIRYGYGRKTGVCGYGGDWGLKKTQYRYGRLKIKPGANLITIKIDNENPRNNTW
jgi:hypothetical protein